jgi:hypothetical protein
MSGRSEDTITWYNSSDTTVRLWNFECHTPHAPIEDHHALLEAESSLFSDSVRRVLREAGHPLDLPTRRLMEGGLMSDFGDVVIHTSDLSHCVNSALGTRAFAVGNHVIFSKYAYNPDSGFGRMLLVHELAHVVQQRLGITAKASTSRAGRIAAEIEADAAAWELLHGRRFACASPLPFGTLSAWGPAGHYYTVYYVLLAAGLADGNACRLAFFAQMPDQVKEFDAVVQGITQTAENASVDHSIADNLRKFDATLRCLNIQLGLHCLTGRNSSLETRIRRHVVLEGCKFESDIGLALHPFGDSFAHRKLDDEGKMYHWPYGHAFDGHETDYIHRRPNLYRNYVGELFDLACKKWPDAKRRIDQEKLLASADEVSSKNTESAQIKAIRAFGAQIRCAMNAYAPEAERKRAFAVFTKAHAVNPSYFSRVLALASSWRSATDRAEIK